MSSSIMRRFSRNSSVRKNQQQTPQSPTSYGNPNIISGPVGAGVGVPSQSTAPGGHQQALGDGYMVLPHHGGGAANEGRPISSATDASFDFANHPGTGASQGARSGGGTMSSQMAGGGLSRTDQIVLKHFWETKYQESAKRDLHYLQFPYFPQHPSHKDLLPYCEIYHLVKTSPGASIVSLGSADGVYIGFELQTGSQLHIDLDDDWFANSNSTSSITHNRVSFRPYASMIADPDSAAMFKSWRKPLTIEFLEDQYQDWCHDLMSLCWEGHEVRQLAGSGGSTEHVGDHGNLPADMPQHHSAGGTTGAGTGSGLQSAVGSVNRPNAGSAVDDGYVSEKSTEQGI